MINSNASKVNFMKSAIALSVAALILTACGKGGDKAAAVP